MHNLALEASSVVRVCRLAVFKWCNIGWYLHRYIVCSTHGTVPVYFFCIGLTRPRRRRRPRREQPRGVLLGVRALSPLRRERGHGLRLHPRRPGPGGLHGRREVSLLLRGRRRLHSRGGGQGGRRGQVGRYGGGHHRLGGGNKATYML